MLRRGGDDPWIACLQNASAQKDGVLTVKGMTQTSWQNGEKAIHDGYQNRQENSSGTRLKAGRSNCDVAKEAVKEGMGLNVRKVRQSV